MKDFLKNLWGLIWSGPVIAGSILVAALLLAASFAYFFFQPEPADIGVIPTASIYVIDGPTATAIPPTPTRMPAATETPEVVTGTDIGINSLVQITGTDGEGLNLRTLPNTTSNIQFLGFDLEIFKVVDGPIFAEGYWWWYLETPVEHDRSGWAVEDFLEIIE